MKKKLILLFFVIFISCKYSESVIPIKPQKIPKIAFWVGGSDGGNWYVVKNINSHRNSALISIYNENGDLIISKKFFVMCSEHNQTLLTNLEKQINAFDGNKILLIDKANKKSCWLQ